MSDYQEPVDFFEKIVDQKQFAIFIEPVDFFEKIVDQKQFAIFISLRMKHEAISELMEESTSKSLRCVQLGQPEKAQTFVWLRGVLAGMDPVVEMGIAAGRSLGKDIDR
jgi:hypothetical protein